VLPAAFVASNDQTVIVPAVAFTAVSTTDVGSPASGVLG
jgi:hypothetical protein